MAYDNTSRRLRYQTDPEYRELLKARRREYLARRPDTRHNTVLKQYGINIEQYQAILLVQDGKCAICHSTSTHSKRTKRFCVDHDHVTGKVRGLLCSSCNRALGLFKDSTKVLLKAAEYLNVNS